MTTTHLESHSPTAAPSGEAPMDLAIERAADVRVVAVVVVIGIAGDVAVRSGFLTLGGALGIAVAAIALLLSGRVVRREARVLVAAAPAFGCWVGFRQSPWLVPFDLVAAVLLLVLGASVARGGSIFDLSPRRFVRWGASGIGHTVAGPAFVAGPLRGRRSGAVARGLLVATPIVVLLTMLLASADAVFAALLGTETLGGDDVLAHVALFIGAAWGGAGLLRITSARRPAEARPAERRFGVVEASVVLGAVVAVLGVFAVAQVLNLVGAAERIVATQGLTYAEYARSGFFQLLFVAAIVVTVVLAVRAVTAAETPAARRATTGLGLVALGLTLPVVVVSIIRLGLYQDQYGLTMLRLYSTVAAYAVGVIIVLVAFAVAGCGAGRSWLPGAMFVTVLVALFALDVANPEAIVARVDLERDRSRVPVDPWYLARLSDDAVPTIVARLDDLDPETRDVLVAELCSPVRDAGIGLASNRSTRGASDALAAIC